MQPKTIGTHSGNFHTDEVLGTMMLVNFTKEFRNAKVVRSRDPEVLRPLDLILDVGDVYDPATHRYDHHQMTFSDTFSEKFNTRLSSSGLIYKHFGQEIIRNALDSLFTDGVLNPTYRFELTDEDINALYVRMYNDFFEYVDGTDNGIPQYSHEVKPRYRPLSDNMVGRIGRLNNNAFRVVQKSKDELFVEGMKIARQSFLEDLEYVYIDMFTGFPIVEKAVQKRFEIHPSGSIIFLEKSCSWKSAIFRIEEKYKIENQLKFVMFFDSSSGDFRTQTIPSSISGQGFEFRKGLREDLRGTRADVLRKLSGVEDAKFVHHSGFIGGADSLAGALKLAELSL